MVCAVEVMEGANYWTLELLRAFPTHMNKLEGTKTPNLNCYHNHPVIYITELPITLRFTFLVCVKCFRSKKYFYASLLCAFACSRVCNQNVTLLMRLLIYNKDYEYIRNGQMMERVRKRVFSTQGAHWSATDVHHSGKGRSFCTFTL